MIKYNQLSLFTQEKKQMPMYDLSKNYSGKPAPGTHRLNITTSQLMILIDSLKDSQDIDERNLLHYLEYNLKTSRD